MTDRAARLVATFFGCGYAPFAPGTAGSVAAFLLAWAARTLWGWDRVEWISLAVLSLVPAVWAAGRTAMMAGAADPSLVVVDEVVGCWVTLALAAPATGAGWAAAFLLFRVFDITKPFPVRRLERLPGGVGIVADDVGAGVYAAAAIWLIEIWLRPGPLP